METYLIEWKEMKLHFKKNDIMELTKQDKIKALKYFKDMEYDKKKSYNELSMVEKLKCAAKLMNSSVFVNTFKIQLEKDCFVKKEKDYWTDDLYLFLLDLKYDKDINFNLFCDHDKALNYFKKIEAKDLFFPYFRIEVKEGLIRGVWCIRAIKKKIKGADKIDKRTLEQLEDELSQKAIDINMVYNYKQIRLKKLANSFVCYDYNKQLNSGIYENMLIPEDHEVGMCFKYLGYVHTVKELKTKKGNPYQRIDVEGKTDNHKFMIWDNMGLKFKPNTAYIFFMKIISKKNKRTGIAGKELKIVDAKRILKNTEVY